MLNKLAMLVAPPVDSPLEDLRINWSKVKHFYIDKKEDVETFQELKIPEAIVNMVMIIIEEEAQLKTIENAGPCLEYFLNNKIVETYCGLAKYNKPEGVRKLCFLSLSNLLRDISHPILPLASFHKPLLSLIVHCNKTNEIESSEYVALLDSILVRLKSCNYWTEFFIYQDPQTNEIIFPIFEGLQKHIHIEGKVGARCKESILFCLSLPFEPQIVETLNLDFFCESMLNDLVSLYKALPLATELTFNKKSMIIFLKHLHFCAQLSKINGPISKTIIDLIEDKFLIDTIGSALLQINESLAVSSTIYFREIFSYLESPLLDVFIIFTLGDFKKPETIEEETDHLIRSTLISRINSKNQDLSISTLKLFSNLLKLLKQDILTNLISRNLQPYSNKIVKENQIDLETIQHSVTSFLNLFSNRTTIGSGYEAYLVDAQENISKILETVLNNWEDPAIEISLQNDKKIEEQEQLYCGSFLNAIYIKLDNIFEQSLQENLVLTGLISNLCQFPQPLLYYYLLHINLPKELGERSIFKTIQQLSNKVDEYSSNLPNYEFTLSNARKEMEESESRSTLDAGLQKFFQGVIVLEEFTKELAAILQARLIVNITLAN